MSYLCYLHAVCVTVVFVLCVCDPVSTKGELTPSCYGVHACAIGPIVTITTKSAEDVTLLISRRCYPTDQQEMPLHFTSEDVTLLTSRRCHSISRQKMSPY